MKTIDVKLPVFAFPIKNLEEPCVCEDRPVELTYKKGQLFWRAKEGSLVSEGEVIAELEVEKKTLEILAPEAGTIHLLAESGDEVDFQTVIAKLGVS